MVVHIIRQSDTEDDKEILQTMKISCENILQYFFAAGNPGHFPALANLFV